MEDQDFNDSYERESKKEGKTRSRVKSIKVKNKLNQKFTLNFPFGGRSLNFGPRETKELTQEEFDSKYFKNREKYFMIIGG